MASPPLPGGGQAAKIGPLPSPCRSVNLPREPSRARKGPQGSLRGSERVPKGTQKGPQGASEGHLEFVCFLGTFLEGKMLKKSVPFLSQK